MSLLGWQAALLKILPNPETADHILMQEAGQLTLAEKDNLRQMSLGTGMEVTRDVQIWWRQARLQTAVPFSMRLMQRLELHQLLELYQKQPCTTLFFLREAQAFRDFIQHHPQAPIMLRDMTRFECALHLTRLQQSGAAPVTDPDTDSSTTELSLSYCPEACLSALLNNTELPPIRAEGVTIQFNSSWPRLWLAA